MKYPVKQHQLSTPQLSTRKLKTRLASLHGSAWQFAAADSYTPIQRQVLAYSPDTALRSVPLAVLIEPIEAHDQPED